MKQCRKCGLSKPLSDFSKKCDTADGLTSRCKACLSEARKADYAMRKELILARNAEWYSANKAVVREGRRERYDPEKSKALSRQYYQRNKAKCRELADRWAIKNPEKLREVWRNYSRRNRDYRNMQSSRRRAAKRNRYPLWGRELTDFVMREASALARKRTKVFGFSWDVDHIVPLLGEKVSGLHVWSNLQVIPSSLNRAKSNKWLSE